MFGSVLILAVTLTHLYVFWHVATVPLLERHVTRKVLAWAGLVLWSAFFFGRVLGHSGMGAMAGFVEMVGMTWMGVLFLIAVSLFAVELITGFGFFLPRTAPTLRGLALFIGGVLSVIALVQGLRPPVVQNFEVSLSGLPRAMDGTVIIAVSDLHLGSQLDKQWLEERLVQIIEQRPDLVVLLGDLFEGHGMPQGELLPVLRRFSAPLGVWADLREQRSSSPIHPGRLKGQRTPVWG